MSHLGASLGTLIFIAIAFALYWTPTIVAYRRQVNKKIGIVLVNALLGWTIVGWFGSLIWACMAETEQQARLREAAYANMAAVPRATGNFPT